MSKPQSGLFAHSWVWLSYLAPESPCGNARAPEKNLYNGPRCGKSGEKWGKVGKTVDKCLDRATLAKLG
jgi:hypothetical protein